MITSPTYFHDNNVTILLTVFLSRQTNLWQQLKPKDGGILRTNFERTSEFLTHPTFNNHRSEHQLTR